ncbi:MAG: hypothetical protein M3275_09810 [Thermoproteota archaeon]|nr:hypothetical protein [Thermoproteota archaeon]
MRDNHVRLLPPAASSTSKETALAAATAEQYYYIIKEMPLKCRLSDLDVPASKESDPVPLSQSHKSFNADYAKSTNLYERIRALDETKREEELQRKQEELEEV